MHLELLEWFIENMDPEEFRDKRVLDVGSRYVNGSVRPIVEKFCKPREYIGVDIEDGGCVDVLLPVEDVCAYFGEESFDVVISTELLEHVKNWRLAINNVKKVLKQNGLAFVTTVSRGIQYHV